MWLCFNDAFLSVIANRPIPRRSRCARAATATSRRCSASRSRSSRYQFRAFVPRRVVADTVAAKLVDFKDSVADATLHDAYMKVWGVMADLQEIPPYGTEPRKGFCAHPVRSNRPPRSQ